MTDYVQTHSRNKTKTLKKIKVLLEHVLLNIKINFNLQLIRDPLLQRTTTKLLLENFWQTFLDREKHCART